MHLWSTPRSRTEGCLTWCQLSNPMGHNHGTQYGYWTIFFLSIQNKTTGSQVPQPQARDHTGISIAWGIHWEPDIWDPGWDPSSRLAVVFQSTFSGVQSALSFCHIPGTLSIICKHYWGDRGWLALRLLQPSCQLPMGRSLRIGSLLLLPWPWNFRGPGDLWSATLLFCFVFPSNRPKLLHWIPMGFLLLVFVVSGYCLEKNIFTFVLF